MCLHSSPAPEKVQRQEKQKKKKKMNRKEGKFKGILRI